MSGDTLTASERGSLLAEYNDVLALLLAHKAGEDDAEPYTTFGLRELCTRLVSARWNDKAKVLADIHNGVYPEQAFDLIGGPAGSTEPGSLGTD